MKSILGFDYLLTPRVLVFFYWIAMVLILIGVFTPPFTMQNLFPLVALANYFLFFGKESKGLPEEFLEAHRQETVRIPMFPGIRSLNLSNSVAVTVYEALRQLDFPGLQDHGKMRENSPT